MTRSTEPRLRYNHTRIFQVVLFAIALVLVVSNPVPLGIDGRHLLAAVLAGIALVPTLFPAPAGSR